MLNLTGYSEMQIKTTVSYIRLAIIKRQITISPAKDVMNFPGGTDGKVSVYNAGDPGSIPREGNGNPLQYPCLEKPMNRGAR